MLAAWCSTMLLIKFYAAPWIVHEWGWAGVVVTILGLLAIGKWLED